MTAYIYHFSANINSPACKRDITVLKELAKANGYERFQIFIDGTLKTGEQAQFDAMMQRIKTDTDSPCVFLMDLYHFNKWTHKAISEAKELRRIGVKVVTKRDGEIRADNALDKLKEPKKVAFYFSSLTGVKERAMQTQLRIAEVFCQEKTKWEISGIYYDSADARSAKMQPELERVIADADNYEALIIGSFQQIDPRTARFIKLRNQLGLDIYSMQEGMLHKKGGA